MKTRNECIRSQLIFAQEIFLATFFLLFWCVILYDDPQLSSVAYSLLQSPKPFLHRDIQQKLWYSKTVLIFLFFFSARWEFSPCCCFVCYYCQLPHSLPASNQLMWGTFSNCLMRKPPFSALTFVLHLFHALFIAVFSRNISAVNAELYLRFKYRYKYRFKYRYIVAAQKFTS